MTLAELIDRELQTIVERWVERIRPLAPRPGLSDEVLKDSLPGFLGELSRALRHLDDPASRSSLPVSSAVAEEHGGQRQRLGFRIDAVAREYPILQEVLIDLAISRGVQLQAAETSLLARCMGTGAAEALAHFFTGQETQLRRSAIHARARRAVAEEELERAHDAEARSRESQALLATVVDAIPSLINFVDAGERYRINNAAYRTWLGIDPASLRGKTVREVAGEQNYRTLEPTIRRALAGELVHYQAPYRWPDGREGDIEGTYVPHRGPDGKVVGFVSLVHDTTERRRLEVERQRAVDALEGGEPICVLDPGFRFLLVNRAMEQLTGKGREELLGHPLWESAPDAAHPASAAWRELNRAMRDRVEVRFEQHHPATSRWSAVSAFPTQEGGLAVFYREITANKQLEAERDALHARERLSRDEAEAQRIRLLALIEQAPMAVAVWTGPEHVFEIANVLYEQQAGKRIFRGRPVREVFPDLASQGIFELLDRVYRTGEPATLREVPVAVDRTRTGVLEPGYYTFSLVAVRDGLGEITGVMQMSVEVTDMVEARLRAERAGEEAARHAEQEARLREFEQQLLGIASHDLRNPLSAILLSTQTQLQREGLDPKSVTVLGRIQDSTHRAIRLVRDLLDFTRARVGSGIPVERQPQDFHALVRGAVDEVEAVYPERTVRLVTEGDGAGAWDGDRIAQVVSNLVTNAVNYSPADTAVEVRSSGGAGEVSLRVHNEGAPIGEAELARIFEPMQRAAHGTDRQARSVGLGLYIVKHLVEAHGGTIEVRSVASEGTTFTVTMPR